MAIALLTDFGTKDYFVGAMKGAILKINKDAQIVDITHQIPPHDIAAAAFNLRACYRDFPDKTIFVAVVDPGVGSNRKAILVETERYYFIAPDNGLLSFVFEESLQSKAFELTEKQFFAPKISRTFHGRDVFAPVAAYLSKGIEPNAFGAEIEDFVRLKTFTPEKNDAGEIEATIIHADQFGNLVTNLKPENLPEKFTLEANGKIINKRRDFYAEAEKSELFVIAGSAGFLEIVAFQDSAKRLLNIEVGEKILVKQN